MIQTLLDVSTLTLANVTRRLKAAEEELEASPPTVHHNGKLYLSEEAWEEKWHLRDGEKNPGGRSRGRGGEVAKMEGVAVMRTEENVIQRGHRRLGRRSSVRTNARNVSNSGTRP
jgi:hypothetical protein